jgi:hypothetical protein
MSTAGSSRQTARQTTRHVRRAEPLPIPHAAVAAAAALNPRRALVHTALPAGEQARDVSPHRPALVDSRSVLAEAQLPVARPRAQEPAGLLGFQQTCTRAGRRLPSPPEEDRRRSLREEQQQQQQHEAAQGSSTCPERGWGWGGRSPPAQAQLSDRLAQQQWPAHADVRR